MILRSAHAILGVPVPLEAIDSAADYLRGEKTIGKSRKRSWRLSADEEQRILDHLATRKWVMPAGDLVRFALHTARRHDEICWLKWADLDRAKGIALVDDVKHPTRKKGNRRAFRLLPETREIIDRKERPEVQNPEDRVFPFEPKSIGAAFLRATRVLEIPDLRFHDLRHEATSRLFERGYSIQEVGQFTLHESWATAPLTERHA